MCYRSCFPKADLELVVIRLSKTDWIGRNVRAVLSAPCLNWHRDFDIVNSVGANSDSLGTVVWSTSSAGTTFRAWACWGVV